MIRLKRMKYQLYDRPIVLDNERYFTPIYDDVLRRVAQVFRDDKAVVVVSLAGISTNIEKP